MWLWLHITHFRITKAIALTPALKTRKPVLTFKKNSPLKEESWWMFFFFYHSESNGLNFISKLKKKKKNWRVFRTMRNNFIDSHPQATLLKCYLLRSILPFVIVLPDPTWKCPTLSVDNETPIVNKPLHILLHTNTYVGKAKQSVHRKVLACPCLILDSTVTNPYTSNHSR